MTPSTEPPQADAAAANGALRLGTYRPIWAAPESRSRPRCKYLIARQQVELSPEDAGRLGIADGDEVTVSQNGTRLSARAARPLRRPRGHRVPRDGDRVGFRQRADRAD